MSHVHRRMARPIGPPYRTDIYLSVLWLVIPYTAKLLRGKTFAVVHKTHYSLENFRGASGPCHYVLYTANDSRGKLSRLAKNRKNHESFAVYGIRYITVQNSLMYGFTG